MKTFLILLALTAPAFAQVVPSTPTKFTTRGTGASAGVGAAVTETKGKPLAASDKKFLKDALESMYFEMEVIGAAKNGAKLEGTRTVANTLKADLDKIWGEVAAVASERAEKIPDALAGADKSKLERLGKSGDRFDKEFFKTITREADKLAKSFETAAKSATDPGLKEIAGKWGATLKEHTTKLDTAEKETGKAK